MTFRGWRLILTLGLVVGLSFGALGVRWSPGEIDLLQDPGAQESYILVLQNDSTEVADLHLCVADWLRTEEGVNDFGVPLNGARWVLERSFAAGETVEIRYSVRLPASGSIGVQGSFRTWTPQVIEKIGGVSTIGASSSVETGTAPSSALTSVSRSIENVDEFGTATIVLAIRTAVDFEGLTITEACESGVEISSLDAAGGRFNTVNQSCADWITLSRGAVRLEPEESVEIVMTVTTPDGFSGQYWCILMAESRDVVIGEVSGTQVITRPSVGLKVFVSAPNTLAPAAEVTNVRVIALETLMVEATFVNTGNVQLVVTSEAQIVDQTGEPVRAFRFTEHGRDYFRILPGSTRTIVLIDYSGAPRLPDGMYQAIVSFNFGGDSLVVGVRGFRVR